VAVSAPAQDPRTAWLLAHRELQYLRAAARTRPRRRLRKGELASRRAYAGERWAKQLQVSHLAP
jgi:hypothetical protein